MIRYLFIALVALTIKVVKYGSVGYGVFKTGETLAQNYSTAGINADGSYEVFKTNEPTNLFGNRKVVFRITSDFRYHFLRARDIYIDSISGWPNPFVTSGARISWIDPSTKKLCFSSVDSLHMDYNTLKNKPASAQALTLTAVGASFTGSSPSMTLTVPTYSNLNQFTNGPGYITSYSMTNISAAGSATVSGSAPNYTINTPVFTQSVQVETDPTVSAAAKTISAGDITNWNGKLSSEVDGSVINEIQTISLTGNTVSLTGGGSIVIPTQTTALTSPQVTNALGYTPLQTEIDGSTSNELQTISGSGTNTLTLSNGGGTFIVPTQSFSTIVTASTGISVTNNSVITNTAPNQTVNVFGGNGVRVTGSYPNYTLTSTDYTATAATSGSVATFYLTSTGTSTGTALYTNVSYVNPIINDVNGNYTFGWSYNAGTKALTVSARVATNTAVIALLGISLLGSTTPVPNATQISVLVKGN